MRLYLSPLNVYMNHSVNLHKIKLHLCIQKRAIKYKVNEIFAAVDSAVTVVVHKRIINKSGTRRSPGDHHCLYKI